mmetsp:Transcript_32049/g.49674  ORF Transcript_32049/g.49674 Transcript_32049/m.49674 type:complete len:436 (-) Transcript_32049:260-1567(-)|eukprot:CAMPEP_0117011404 /NCGR_PEP_ID=MMETSP0472-20121206/9808_1 /TAXON_ID=693140 ORGANISM="Tiarina fusus, Strain LIS" /NCGR_SAMPLE_ID=MMETSP0472 /ASSEMBLY_ACC=CAM_ASM_000603 /LENGTH=435 /DNA_ID=CAMNT_0004714187 /DNA_START=44 /DNA_END=1351 /DNA_ORIENTATION=+
MKLLSPLFTIALTACFSPAAQAEKPALDLSEAVLTTSLIAANLSSRAYDDATLWASNDTDTGFFHPDFDSIKFYTNEPDQAIVAQKNGLCFLAFRGTNANIDDWSQNAGLGNIDVFRDNLINLQGESCEARGGFADFLQTTEAVEGLVDLEACLANCTSTDCLVITGHSQGGAASAIAAVTLFRHSPTVITFGQPPTMDAGCPYIISEKYYRYVNSMKDIAEDDDMGFDLVVFAPNWISRSEHYGYYIMLGEDPTAVNYLGFDTDYTFVPNLEDNDPNAHSMSGTPFAYETRIAALLENLPVSLAGNGLGFICENDYAELCESNTCPKFECIPETGLEELCIYNSCDEDDDCAGDAVCIYDSCAAGPGLVEPGCACFKDDDCAGDVECITISLLAAEFRCEGGNLTSASADPIMRNAGATLPLVSFFTGLFYAIF